MTINFSFIIPHKNTPDLLQKCLDSIPRREGVQIIIVDDDSDPQKVDFEHFPGLNDPSVEVYLTKEGKGAGYARNVGLDHAVGKWIVFADADDSFHGCINDVLDFCGDRNEDIIFFKSDSINLLDGTDGHRADEYNRRVDISLQRGEFEEVLKYSSPCGKVFRRSLLEENHTRFNVVRYSNDVVFMSKVAVCAETFCSLDIVAYCISVRDNSLTSTGDKSSILIRLKEDLEGWNITKDKFPPTTTDNYWLCFTWYGLYQYSLLKAVIYWPKFLFIIGPQFMKDSIGMIRHDIKNHPK